MSINPNAKSLPRGSLDVKSLVRGIQIGDRSMLSQAITLVESRKIADRVIAKKLIQSLPKNKNTSFRIGITGNPGVGKSTLIERLGNIYIESGHRIAVLAFDPSSPNSGGSILGDKTRMEKLSKENNVVVFCSIKNKHKIIKTNIKYVQTDNLFCLFRNIHIYSKELDFFHLFFTFFICFLNFSIFIYVTIFQQRGKR